MDIVKTLEDAGPFLTAYPIWVRVLVGITILMCASSILAVLLSSKTIPVDKWLPVSDNSTIKALVPTEMFDEWETKKHTVDELTERLPSPLATKGRWCSRA